MLLHLKMEILNIVGKIEERLIELGIIIPEAPKPVAAYIPAKRVGNLINPYLIKIYFELFQTCTKLDSIF